MKDSHSAILKDLKEIIKRIDNLQKKNRKVKEKISQEKDTIQIKKLREFIETQ